MNESEFALACDLAEHKLDLGRLRAENAKLWEAAKAVVREHDRIGSTARSRREAIVKLREALEGLRGTCLG